MIRCKSSMTWPNYNLQKRGRLFYYWRRETEVFLHSPSILYHFFILFSTLTTLPSFIPSCLLSNQGVKEELAHLTSLIQTKVLKNDEERRDFASYAQERARMRDEIDVLRAQLRGETAKNAAMRVETDEARSALADHTRNKEEKERSVLRLRAALTNMEVLSSPSTPCPPPTSSIHSLSPLPPPPPPPPLPLSSLLSVTDLFSPSATVNFKVKSF